MKDKFRKYIKLLSFGQYETKFYYGNKQSTYSTVMGGWISIFSILFLFIVSLSILVSTFKIEEYSSETQFNDMNEDREFVNSIKMRDFFPSLLNISIIVPE